MQPNNLLLADACASARKKRDDFQSTCPPLLLRAVAVSTARKRQKRIGRVAGTTSKTILRKAKAEAEIQPNAVGDDLGGKTVSLVARRGGGIRRHIATWLAEVDNALARQQGVSGGRTPGALTQSKSAGVSQQLGASCAGIVARRAPNSGLQVAACWLRKAPVRLL